MVRKYGRIGNVSVTLMERASKGLKKGQVAVQSLATGDTAIVARSKVKGITKKYPKLK